MPILWIRCWNIIGTFWTKKDKTKLLISKWSWNYWKKWVKRTEKNCSRLCNERVDLKNMPQVAYFSNYTSCFKIKYCIFAIEKKCSMGQKLKIWEQQFPETSIWSSWLTDEKMVFIKVITGMRRCGKSTLLQVLFRDYLLKQNIPADHIISIALDDRINQKLRNPDVLLAYIRQQVRDNQCILYLWMKYRW